MRLGFLIVSSWLIAGTGEARACSIQPPPANHQIDPGLQAVDATPPSVPRVREVALVQDHDSPPGDSCGDLSSLGILFDQVSVDDHSTRDQIGYAIEILDGRLPAALQLPTEPVRLDEFGGEGASGSLFFVFGESNEDVRFTLRIYAVDEAGNRSAATPPISVLGAAGCSAAGSGDATRSGDALLWSLSLLLIARAARSRAVART